MEKNEIKDPLYELKDQMLVLKNKLSKETIINEEQTKTVTNKYSPKNPYLWPVLGALIGICCAASSVNDLAFRYDELPMWRLIFDGIFLVFVIIANAYLHGHGHSSTYNIKDGNLYVSNVFTKFVHDGITIPISSIRYIEFLAEGPKNRRARIVYNKFDDLYLFSNNPEAIIADLLRVNPDIEIRHEKKY